MMSDIINIGIGGQYRFVLGAASGISEQAMPPELVKEMIVATHVGDMLSVRLLSDRECDALLVEDMRTRQGWLTQVEAAAGYRLVQSTTGRTLREMILPTALAEAQSRRRHDADTEEMSWWKVRRYWLKQEADGIWRAFHAEEISQDFAKLDRAQYYAQQVALRAFRRSVDSAICELVEL